MGVFRFTDRWQNTLASLLTGHDDKLALLEQRDVELETYLQKQVRTWTTWSPSFVNVTDGDGLFEFQPVSSTALLLSGEFTAGTATAAGICYLSMPPGWTTDWDRPILCNGPLGEMVFAQINHPDDTIHVAKDHLNTDFNPADSLVGFRFMGVVKVVRHD